jgi:hypothetical protein
MAGYILAVCIFVLALVTTGRPARGQTIQQGRGRRMNVRIAGRLMDFNKIPIADATIGLADWKMTVWQPLTRTSATGDFVLRVRLQPGS